MVYFCLFLNKTLYKKHTIQKKDPLFAKVIVSTCCLQEIKAPKTNTNGCNYSKMYRCCIGKKGVCIGVKDLRYSW